MTPAHDVPPADARGAGARGTPSRRWCARDVTSFSSDHPCFVSTALRSHVCGRGRVALDACRDALHQRVVSLVLLEEFVGVLNRGDNLAAMLRAKVTAAMIEKRPFLPV